MTLAQKVTVNAHYTRSVNLERDVDSSAVVGSYIPTTRALATLDRIVDTLKPDQMPRAWSLVGPYGSGKSSFAVFLAHLLAGGDKNAASKILGKSNKALARRFRNISSHSHGHCYALLTGSPEPLSARLIIALAEAAQTYWSQLPGRTPKIVEDLYRLSKKRSISTSDVLSAVSRLQDAIAKSGGNGLLIVIDELGKFLEYEARHYGANDIYLLQALAEHAYGGHEANLSVVVLLHQAFEQYAKGLGENLRNEWAKVQGRFENIPFLESTEQTLRIVAAAFEHRFTDAEAKKLRQQTKAVVTTLADAKALPGSLDDQSAVDLFARCYPLHPLSAFLLPSLCQKVAQNERTLFSYLGSQEPHGFRDSLASLTKLGDWIYPWQIYEYFILNQPAAVNDHLTHRRWAEVVTAIERLGDAPEEEVQLLKTIGVLNIVGAQGGLKASKELIHHCLPTKKSAERTARALVEKSVVQFRKFSGEYRVWQGSDFDLEGAIFEQFIKRGPLPLAEVLNDRHTLMPIVARRHTITSGALRYFVPTFVDASTFRTAKQASDKARIIFFLSEGKDDRRIFSDEVKTHFSDLDIVVEHLNASQIREAVTEVLAIEAVQREAQELQSDPVAQREMKDRYAAALRSERQLLNEITENPEDSVWYWKGEPLGVKSRRSLQTELSRVLDEIYIGSPIIQNELINRDRPSSQANAARNKLLVAMLRHPDCEDLGIDKYPAEKGIYRSLLKAPGLHRKTKGVWRLAPPTKTDPYNFSPVWKRIEQFLALTEKQARPLTELDPELMAPPYGVKAGLLPILYILVYLVNQHELALYEDGVYAPYLTEEHIERFMRQPENFQIQRFRIEGMRASIFEQYSKALYGDSNRRQTLLSIARPIAKFFGELPEYTQHTMRLSPAAREVREAVKVAKTPEELLFNGLPTACGLPPIDPASGDQAALEGFAERLTELLRELKYAYDDFLDRQRKLVCQAFNLTASTPLPALRATLRGRLAGLDNYTVDVDGLRGFILRATKDGIDDDAWLAALLMFLGKSKSPRRWTESDEDAAEFRLSEFARRLNDLERLRVHYEGEKASRGADFEVLLVRTVRQGTSETDELVSIDKRIREAIAKSKGALQEQLEQLGDKELQLALLAELTDEFLVAYRNGRANGKATAIPTPVHAREKESNNG